MSNLFASQFLSNQFAIGSAPTFDLVKAESTFVCLSDSKDLLHKVGLFFYSLSCLSAHTN